MALWWMISLTGVSAPPPVYMMIDFRKKPPPASPLFSHGQVVEVAQQYKCTFRALRAALLSNQNSIIRKVLSLTCHS